MRLASKDALDKNQLDEAHLRDGDLVEVLEPRLSVDIGVLLLDHDISRLLVVTWPSDIDMV